MKHPIIYIAGLMRTGTTLLQELLSKDPYSYIFHEPWFGSNRFLNQEYIPLKILNKLSDRNDWTFPEILRRLDRTMQVGVKEIRHMGWDKYIDLFGVNMRFILTGRDPRDIYISCYDRLNRDNAWKPLYLPFTPANMVRELEPDWRRMEAMMGAADNWIKLKYEDFCVDPGPHLGHVMDFIDSPIPRDAPGDIGAFLGKIPREKPEVEKHQGKVTAKAVNRWKKMQPDQLWEDAHKFAKFMEETLQYCSTWGYEI